ncbi:MAG: YecA family protein [Bacillota bacterium]
MSEIDIERILTHVSGCLYYYGAMSGRDLYERLREFGEMEMPYAKFSQLVRSCGKDWDSEYPFIYEDKIFYYMGVEDPSWVIAGHQSRPEIPFCPVTLEVGKAVVEDRVEFLWTKHGKKLYEWMFERQEVINEDNKDMTKLAVLEIMDAMRNDNRPGEVLQRLLDNVVLESFDETKKAMQMVMDIWNNIPHWVLKGWTPNEVMEKYEKPALKQPLPATGFPISAESVQPKGRNDPCPCGSGKKYKRCCLIC